MGKGEDMLEFVGDRPGHDQKYALDHSKIERELGWQPKYGLEESLKILVDWFKDNEMWWKRVKSGEYVKFYEQQYTKR
jgi:dTDP-glucose 4,6-dehydratase